MSKNKGVTLTKEQLEVENKEIKNVVESQLRELILPLVEEMKDELKEEKEKVAKDVLPETEEEFSLMFSKSIESLISNIFKNYIENTKIEVQKIKYISNNKASVVSKLLMPSTDEIDKIDVSDEELEKKFLEKSGYKMKDLEKLGKKDANKAFKLMKLMLETYFELVVEKSKNMKFNKFDSQTGKFDVVKKNGKWEFLNRDELKSDILQNE